MFHRVHVPQCFSAYMFLVFPSVHVARVSKVHAAMFPSVHSLHSSCFCLVHNLCFLQYTFSSAFIVFLSSTQFGVSYSTQLSRISVFLFSTLFSVSYSTLLGCICFPHYSIDLTPPNVFPAGTREAFPPGTQLPHNNNVFPWVHDLKHAQACLQRRNQLWDSFRLSTRNIIKRSNKKPWRIWSRFHSC